MCRTRRLWVQPCGLCAALSPVLPWLQTAADVVQGPIVTTFNACSIHRRSPSAGLSSSADGLREPLLRATQQTAMHWALVTIAALSATAPVAARLASTRGLPAAVMAGLRSCDPMLVAAAAAVVGNLSAHKASQSVVGSARGLAREVVRSGKEARDAASLVAIAGEHSCGWVQLASCCVPRAPRSNLTGARTTPSIPRRASAGALRNLLACDPGRQELAAEPSTVPLLIRLLEPHRHPATGLTGRPASPMPLQAPVLPGLGHRGEFGRQHAVQPDADDAGSFRGSLRLCERLASGLGECFCALVNADQVIHACVAARLCPQPGGAFK